MASEINHNSFRQLYEKYLLEKSREEERNAFLQFLPDVEDDELQDVEEVLAMETSEMRLPEKRSAEIYRNITGENLSSKRMSYRFNPLYLSAAALFIGILFAGLYFWKSSPQQNDTPYPEMASFSNPTRFVKSLMLPDGSKVFLKQGARLALLSDFGKDTIRRVKLTGEALFEVEKNPEKAFCIVESGTFDVRVLGTSFNFKNLATENNLVLNHGKVQVTHKDQKMLVAPGEGVVYNSKKLNFEKSRTDTTASALWVHAFLKFENEPLLRLFSELNTLYPEAHLELHEAYQNQNFTGYLPAGDLEKSIEILNKAFNNTIIFKH